MHTYSGVSRGLKAFVLSMAGLALTSTSVAAQTIVNPTTLEFTPSNDHNTVLNGTAIVARYDLGFYLAGAAQPFQVQSLGKPTPETDGMIRMPVSSLSSLPSAGIIYESRVSAVGPGGSATSTASNTFSFSVPCSYAVAPTGVSVAPTASTGTLTVTAGAGCAWTSVSGATSWLTITSGASGSGNGSVGYSVTANTTTSQRTATISVGGQSVTVTQQAGTATCSYTLSATTRSVPAAQTTDSITVTAVGTCNWTAASNAAWLTVTGGATGSGSRTVTYQAAANSSASGRSGTLTVAGQTVTVNQAGLNCTFTVSPTTQSFTAAGGTVQGSVTTAAGCNWTASSSASWMTFPSGSNGSGPGQFQMAAAPNPAASTRSATLTVAGVTVPVTQQAATCAVTLSPTSVTIVPDGGTGSVTVTVPTGCAWTASSGANWLTITSGTSGSGNGTVGISASANDSATPRTTTLTVGGQTVNVTQTSLAPPRPPAGVRLIR